MYNEHRRNIIFLRHKASGYILDFRYLQTITVYDDFVALCQELEAFENNKNDNKEQKGVRK